MIIDKIIDKIKDIDWKTYDPLGFDEFIEPKNFIKHLLDITILSFIICLIRFCFFSS